MLSIEEATRDQNIFRPNGFIVFPRSDGDPEVRPHNTTVPPPTDAEVNYYHVFARDEDRHERWRCIIGDLLAKTFKLPKVSPGGNNWKLYDFPADYEFTEQRKGPKATYRTDPYLFAKVGHRFRSSHECVPHFEWLIRDPTMTPSNCACKYCTKSKRWSLGGSSASTPTKKAAKTPKAPKPKKSMTAAEAAAVRRGPKPKSDKTVMADANSILIRGVNMSTPTPGVTIVSTPQRDREIMKDLKLGQREGFRLGEVVWCRLQHPVVDPTEPKRQISQWPALVEDPQLIIEMESAFGKDGAERANGEGSTAANGNAGNVDPSLDATVVAEGVVHKQAYQVRFLGTSDTTRALESELSPFLAGFIPEGLLESSLGTMEQHQWLELEYDLPALNLHHDTAKPEPNYTQSIVAFAFAMQTCSILRAMLNATDPYSVANTAAGVVADLQESEEKGSAARQLYQGLYYGTERIWVGEVVRLKLSAKEIKRLQREMNAAIVKNMQPGSADPPAVLLDGDESYVMRLNAIYKDYRQSKAFQVAGEVFQIITATKYHAMQQAADDENEKNRQETEGDVDQSASEKLTRLKLPQSSVLKGKPGFPSMPTLPEGFMLVPLTNLIQSKIPKEVSMPLANVAGRVYPSLGMRADGPRVEAQMKLAPAEKAKAADEDTQDELRARLSIAGLLNGCVKAMGSRQEVISRAAGFKASFDMARADIIRLIKPDDDVYELDQAEEAEVEGAIFTVQDAPEVEGRNQIQAAGSSSKRPLEQATEASGPVKRLKSHEARDTFVAMPTPTKATSTGASEGESQVQLPKGWVSRISKTLGTTYYVHVATKKTQWDVPTESSS